MHNFSHQLQWCDSPKKFVGERFLAHIPSNFTWTGCCPAKMACSGVLWHWIHLSIWESFFWNSMVFVLHQSHKYFLYCTIWLPYCSAQLTPIHTSVDVIVLLFLYRMNGMFFLHAILPSLAWLNTEKFKKTNITQSQEICSGLLRLHAVLSFPWPKKNKYNTKSKKMMLVVP